jgi:hypothetical protein
MVKNVVTVGTLVGLLNVVVIILNNYIQVAGSDQVSTINLILAVANGVIVYLSGNHFLQQPSPNNQAIIVPKDATIVRTDSVEVKDDRPSN